MLRAAKNAPIIRKNIHSTNKLALSQQSIQNLLKQVRPHTTLLVTILEMR